MADIYWHDLLEAYYGVRMNEKKAAMWVRLLREPDAIPDVTEAELCNVLRWVRQKREGENYRKQPTLEMLIGWIKWYRKTKAQDRRGYRDDEDDGFLAHIKSAMLKADSNDERWDIMCDPRSMNVTQSRDTTADECDALRSWAERRWSDFGAPDRKPLPDNAITCVAGDLG